MATGTARIAKKEKTQQWLAKQTGRLLPVHHFLVTVTVPKELGSGKIRTLVANRRYLAPRRSASSFPGGGVSEDGIR